MKLFAVTSQYLLQIFAWAKNIIKQTLGHIQPEPYLLRSA